jgi:anti-anti-sigma regulatory factor
MKCTISTPGQLVVLTLTVDLSINTPNLNRTDLLLDHVVSSPISLLIIDLRSLSCVNSIGIWTIFQVVFKAREQAKGVYLYNLQPALQPYLKEAGILELATAVITNEELGNVLHGNYRFPGSCANVEQVKSSFIKGRVSSAGIASL